MYTVHTSLLRKYSKAVVTAYRLCIESIRRFEEFRQHYHDTVFFHPTLLIQQPYESTTSCQQGKEKAVSTGYEMIPDESDCLEEGEIFEGDSGYGSEYGSRSTSTS